MISVKRYKEEHINDTKEELVADTQKNMSTDIFLAMRKIIMHINLQNTPSIKVNCYLKELNKEKEITWNSKLSLFLM